VRFEVEKWHWNRFFPPKYFGFSPVSVFPPTLHTRQKFNRFLCKLKYACRNNRAGNKKYFIKQNFSTHILPHFTVTFLSHIWLLSTCRRMVFHFRRVKTFNNFLKGGRNMTLKTRHVLVFTKNCKPHLLDILSNSLRAGRSRNRIPVGARFSSSVQTGPGAHPGSYTMHTGSLSRGLSGRSVAFTTHPQLAPKLKKE
jgi:hypothetical protein